MKSYSENTNNTFYLRSRILFLFIQKTPILNVLEKFLGVEVKWNKDMDKYSTESKTLKELNSRFPQYCIEPDIMPYGVGFEVQLLCY